MANTIVINTPTATAGQAFTVSGTSQAPSIPASAMSYKDDSGTVTAFPAGSTVPGVITPAKAVWSYTQPALAVGTHSITVSDASGGSATASFTVTAAGGSFNAILASNDGASLTLPDGKTVTIDDAFAPDGGNIKVNGSNVPGGDHSFAVAVVGGVLYGQDGSGGVGGPWYSDSGETTGNWTPVTAPAGLVYFGGVSPPPPPPPPPGTSHVTCYSQAVLNSVAQNITNQVNGDGVPECFTGTCFPITFRPGDLLVPGSGPTIAGGDFFTDNAGNTWALQSGTGEDGSGHWWGNRVVNGAVVPGGPPDYLCALRLVKGVVYIQHSKFGGWYLGTQTPQTNATQNFVGNEPGPGDFCN